GRGSAGAGAGAARCGAARRWGCTSRCIRPRSGSAGRRRRRGKGAGVALSPELVGFVKEGLARGVGRDEISGVLIDAGWPPDQVTRAMAMYAETSFAIPVPRPVTTGSMRDAFMHVLMFFALIVSCWNFGSLVFEFIDRAFPDPAMRNYYTYRSALEAVRWDLSSLIVAFPLFLAVSWRVSLAI